MADFERVGDGVNVKSVAACIPRSIAYKKNVVFIHLPVQTAFCPSPIGFIMCFLGSNLWILSLIPWIGE